MSDDDPEINMVGTVTALSDTKPARPPKKHPIGFDTNPAHYRQVKRKCPLPDA